MRARDSSTPLAAPSPQITTSFTVYDSSRWGSERADTVRGARLDASSRAVEGWMVRGMTFVTFFSVFLFINGMEWNASGG